MGKKISKKFLPLAGIVLGVLVGLLFEGIGMLSVQVGIIGGLLSMGLYDITSSAFKK